MGRVDCRGGQWTPRRQRLAEAFLQDQAPWGPVHWTIAEGGYPINDGGCSFRNPANRIAWPAVRLARVAEALAS